MMQRLTVRVLICLTETCFLQLKHLDSESSIFVGDIKFDEILGVVLRPELGKEEQEFASRVRDYVISLAREIGDNTVLGFSNAFYECSVAPLASYVAALDHALSNVDKALVEVWFSTDLMGAIRTSSYYLAEHESQGRRFYDRILVFTPYLIDVCRKHGLNPHFVRRRFASKQVLFNFLRTWIVFGVRFFAGLGCLMRQRQQAIPSIVPEMVVITRSCSQTEAIFPFINTSRLRSIFIAGESFLDRGKNLRLIEKFTQSAQEVVFFQLTDPSKYDWFRDYFRSALRILFCKVPKIEYRGIHFRMAQAVRELYVMLPEVRSYERSLDMALARIHRPEYGKIMSLEQKSPHAYIDAAVAHKFGLKCVHVMQSDQHARPLPFPVFGDYFLADTRAKALELQCVADIDAEKVTYIGSFKSCGWFGTNWATRRLGFHKLCFFAHSDDIDANRVTIDLLSRLHCGLRNLIVKLHPRDVKSNYANYQHIEILADGEVDKSTLYSSFDVALTFPSGAVLELIFGDKPIVLLGFGPGNNLFEYNYWDVEYVGCVTSPNEVGDRLADIDNLKVAFRLYRDRYLSKAGVITDVDSIKRSLLELGAGSN